jgi:hypothetical protein
MNTRLEQEAGAVDFNRHRGADTFTCSHCRRFTIVARAQAFAGDKPAGALCTGCMRMICAECTPRGRCTSRPNAWRAAQHKASWWREFERVARC